MNKKQVKALHNGDEVYWNDPDEGLCSKYIVIRHITLMDETDDPIICITSNDGDDLECFAHELS